MVWLRSRVRITPVGASRPIGLRIARYGFEPSPEYNAYIVVEATQCVRMIDLTTLVEPFDLISLANSWVHCPSVRFSSPSSSEAEDNYQSHIERSRPGCGVAAYSLHLFHHGLARDRT